MLPSPSLFIVVDPQQLPMPHNPSRCDFYDKTLWNGPLPLAQRRTRWLDVIEPRWMSCSYHAADWRSIAEAACWVLDLQLRASVQSWTVDLGAHLARFPGGALAPPEADFADSLFSDPIAWLPGEDMVDDGQHRTCALRLAGARAVPVWDESRADPTA
jgi:hypothetical protein